MTELRNITFRYEDKTIFENYSLKLNDGITCIMSPSGIGKTTLLHILAGLRKPESGEILNAPKRPAILFQEDRLLPWFTVEKNLLIIHKDKEKVRKMLKEIDVPPGLYPDELSGGMKRRVALIRALLLPSDALLLDEPFSGMDEALMKRMAALIRKENKFTVVSTHSLREAEELGGRILHLANE